MTGAFPDDACREIAGRARTLHERLDGPPNELGTDPPFDPDELLSTWREQFPDESAFADRLARDGLTESAIKHQLAATRWPAHEPLPHWIADLEAIVVHVESTDLADSSVRPADSPGSGALTIPATVPFTELLSLIAGYATDQFVQRPSAESIPTKALEPMVRWLAGRLDSLGTRALYVEFKSFVAHHDQRLARTDPDEMNEKPTKLYEAFVEAMVDGGIRRFCQEYPVFARQLVTIVSQWIDFVTELCKRITADRAQLSDEFGVTGSVKALDPLSEDAHAAGRIPVRVEFEAGAVVYKPRPVDAGVALYTILTRLDDSIAGPPVRVPRYLSREEYGWMEVIEYRNLADESAASRYYERAGALLCVAYALHLTDCQFENLIVDGEQPTIIDAETLFHPYCEPAASTIPTAAAASWNESVSFTSMLPRTILDPADPAAGNSPSPTAGFVDESGLISLTGRSTPTVKAVNTDVMSVEATTPTVDRTTTTPVVDGEAHLPGEYLEPFVRGFERTYEAIQERHAKGTFLSEFVDRSTIEGIETRFLYRGTRWYSSILQAATARDPLRDGCRLTLEFEELAVPFFTGRIQADRYWPIYTAERRSLRRRDVPRFTASPTNTCVRHDGTPTGVHADATGYERSKQLLCGLSDADRRRQVWLIRRALSHPEPPTRGAPPADLTDDRLTKEAIALGDDLIEAAYETSVGPRWVAYGTTPDVPTVTVLPASVSLYDGRGGIGLAFAALWEVTGEERFRRWALDTLDGVLDVVENRSYPRVLGGTAGLGSVIYVLTVASELLDVDRYRRGATRLTSAVTDEQLATDDVFDVMKGSAGTLLTLLALYDRCGDATVLERAVACGDRLLDARVPVNGYRTWETIDDEPIFGLGHGTSGIAYALSRLAATADEPRFERAAREAFAFESMHYATDLANWLNPGDEEAAAAVDRWCHGRSGIALSRLAAGSYLGDDRLVTEGVDALSATEAAGLGPFDNVCCGNFGRALTLLEAKRRTECELDPASFGARCLTRKGRDGSLSLPGHSETVSNPTFFDGISGAAYALSRLQHPDRLPCVLLLE